jgi:hypothetical protein
VRRRSLRDFVSGPVTHQQEFPENSHRGVVASFLLYGRRTPPDR